MDEFWSGLVLLLTVLTLITLLIWSLEVIWSPPFALLCFCFAVAFASASAWLWLLLVPLLLLRLLLLNDRMRR